MYRPSLYKIFFVAIFAITVVCADASADRADDAYRVAAGYYSLGNWQLAQIELQEYVEKFPQHDRATLARFLLGETLVQLEQFEEAREEFGRFLNIASDHPHAKRAMFRRVEAAVRLGQSDLALVDLQKLSKQYPPDKLDRYVLPMLGRLYLESKKTEKALEQFQQAISRFPDGPLIDQAQFDRARALEQLGEHERAAEVLSKLAFASTGTLADDAQLQLGLMQYNDQQYDKSAATLAVFATTFENSPLRTVAQYWRGLSLVSQQQWPLAAQTFSGELARSPDHKLAAALAHYAGVCFFRTNNLEQAARHHDLVLGKWPDSQWASASLHARLSIASRKTQHSEIDKYSQQFIARFPTDSQLPAVRLTYARSLLQRREYAKARTTLSPLADSTPEATVPAAAQQRQEILFLLSLAYLGEKKHQAALDLLAAVEPDTEHKSSAAGIHLVRGSAMIGLGRFADGVDEIRINLTISPDGPDAGLCRARLTTSLIELQKWDDVERTYGQFMELHPQHSMRAAVTLRFAEAMYAVNRRTRSAELFSVLTDKQYPQAIQARGLSGLAWCQLDHADPSAAAATFDRLLNEHPDSVLASEAAIARAKTLEDLGRDVAALLLYELVDERYPNSGQVAIALLGAARIHDRLEQNDQAVRILERLTGEFSDFSQLSEAYYLWAFLLLDMGNEELAYDKFQQIHDHHTTSRYWPDATYRLANHRYSEGSLKQAKALTEAILSRKDATTVTPHALFLAGKIASRDGHQWGNIERLMGRLLAEYPETPLRFPAQYWIAESFYRRKSYAQAATAFDKLQRSTQGQNDSWLAVIPLRQAQLLALEQKWSDSFSVAQQIEKQFPTFANQYEVDYLLGRCLSKDALFNEARAAYQRVLDSPVGGHTETAAMAQWMTGETYYHQESYIDAIRAYGRVEMLFDYPQWRAAALLQAGKCHEMLGQWRHASDSYAQIGEKYAQTEFVNEAKIRLRVAKQRAQMATPNARIR